MAVPTGSVSALHLLVFYLPVCWNLELASHWETGQLPLHLPVPFVVQFAQLLAEVRIRTEVQRSARFLVFQLQIGTILHEKAGDRRRSLVLLVLAV